MLLYRLHLRAQKGIGMKIALSAVFGLTVALIVSRKLRSQIYILIEKLM